MIKAVSTVLIEESCGRQNEGRERMLRNTSQVFFQQASAFLVRQSIFVPTYFRQARWVMQQADGRASNPEGKLAAARVRENFQNCAAAAAAKWMEG